MACGYVCLLIINVWIRRVSSNGRRYLAFFMLAVAIRWFNGFNCRTFGLGEEINGSMSNR